MKLTKLAMLGLLLGTTLFTSCSMSDKSPVPVALSWESVAANGGYDNIFTIKNVSKEALSNDWAIYYSQFPRSVEQQENAPVKMETVHAYLFRLIPSEHYNGLKAGDSIKVVLHSKSRIQRNSLAPEGPYWIGADGKPKALDINITPLAENEVPRYPDATKIYAENERYTGARELYQTDIFPSVKTAFQNEGSVVLEKVKLVYLDEYKNEATLLADKLKKEYGIKIEDDAPVTISLERIPKSSNLESYTLIINEEGVKIGSITPHGIFNGTQTLLAILKGVPAPYELKCAHIQDEPDLLYRGMMIDIARNFTTVENLKHLIDVLASYKINTLQFHFCDDEAWRLEIPGLEELTEITSRRGFTKDESECLYTNYGGGHDYKDANSSANGYYTRKEFIDFLRYAHARHIQVIPEIESPGHARAAIVAMKARYNKYFGKDNAKAEEYMLVDPQDTSRYSSVQHYNDNVLDVALPSTYRFLEKVIRELKKMYSDADVPLKSIHLGGDEVAKGAWLGSPACQRLMKEKGMTKRHDLAEYYITRMGDFLISEGLRLNGWQEIALGHSTPGHQQMKAQTSGINCWTAVPDWKTDAVVYEIANNGYPVILSNVCNFYMDMTYSYHPDERGLDWGGCVDEVRAFSALPFRNYRSCRTSLKGEPFDLVEIEKDKPNLTLDGCENIIGVQGQLFAETIRSYDWVQYYLFPKCLGLIERGWNAHPKWELMEDEEEQRTFDNAVALYEKKIAEKEMPYWTKKGINFRIAHPGIVLKDGMLYVNAIIPGAEVRYTTDGSEPTLNSALWTKPVPCDSKKVRAKTFFLGKESYSLLLNAE